ncbi:MAG: Fe-S cluster assembly protein SufD [Streptosporangiales bacterium]|nr:Fe-S cluster assembly protein SufD [Streptosporangiales bacterium]
MPKIDVKPDAHGAGAVPAESKLAALASYDVADFPVPKGREEEWRFTPLRRLGGLHSGKAEATGEVVTQVWAPDPVRVEWVGRDDERLGKAGKPTDRIAAQAYSAFEKALVVTVPKETELTEHISIEIKGTAAERPAGVTYGHIQVRLEPFAKAVVVIDHEGLGTYADNIEFLVGDGAALSVVSLQGWSDKAVHVSQHHARLDRDASFKSFLVSLGGDVVRISPSVRYAGPGGDAELYGLYFVDPGQHIEHRSLVDHAQSNCRSRVEYKGALQGEDAHAVWIGDVIIGEGTEGTDTYEYNRNLVLTDGTRVDSVPNLEIFTGEVQGAGHASASGRLEDIHIFYLMARGIPFEEARRLVIRGYFGALIQKIDVPELRERVMAEVEDELERVR